MDMLNYQNATYLKSAAELDQLPSDDGVEVAFIGRSNAGKSSALNAVTGLKGLARTSNTPGRTQMINLFQLDKCRRLVDLPGYGYAKVPRVVQERWSQNINLYLQQRQCLHGLVLVMDIRHPLKELDQKLIEWTVDCGVPLHILLTKADKLKSAAARRTLKEVSDVIAEVSDDVTVQIFSSIDKVGIDEAKLCLNQWFQTAE